jgi:hypothetical protein
MCAFHRYWAGLQNEKDKELLLEGPLDCREVLRRLMRWPGLPDLPVQESRSVKMKTMKSSLLEEEHGKGKSVLEMNHGS